jgi:hypothetical protein
MHLLQQGNQLIRGEFGFLHDDSRDQTSERCPAGDGEPPLRSVFCWLIHRRREIKERRSNVTFFILSINSFIFSHLRAKALASSSSIGGDDLDGKAFFARSRRGTDWNATASYAALLEASERTASVYSTRSICQHMYIYKSIEFFFTKHK